MKDHGLEKHSYQEISTWGFADWVFNQDTDWFSNVNKVRASYWHIIITLWCVGCPEYQGMV